ncbi:MAG: DUF5320 family protein [Deltaproteobacteria bacterium]|nr:DUF5320 family protein [Deltaproteobacteria bacterium]
MPSGDRRGPDGAGPMTGRQLGHCAGYDEPGFVKNVPGRGRGRGRGRGYGRSGGGRGYGRGRGGEYGRGYDRGYDRPVIVERHLVSSSDQKELIEDRINQMKNEIKILEKQMADANKKNEK